ncbi:MAG: tetrahydrofolate dehydrogenase/cyclohydrolase catalytic domain-containing protein [Candidatus Kerfeldbacteria bacterium]
MTNLIDGRALALSIRSALPARIKRLPRIPGLGVILIGNDKASELYVKLKKRAADEAGILFNLNTFPAETDAETIQKRIQELNGDPRIDAALIQLPLPSHLNEQTIIKNINPEKDVDGFHPVNIARFLNGERPDPPSLIEGILRLIDSTSVVIQGLRSTIVARKSVFTQCLLHALKVRGAEAIEVPADGLHHNATVISDIVIVAAGRPKLITGDDCKPGSIVIDVGINSLPNGNVVGDVERSSAEKIVRWLTPVPGGVGPMTIAMLLENAVRLAERNQS